AELWVLLAPGLLDREEAPFDCRQEGVFVEAGIVRLDRSQPFGNGIGVRHVTGRGRSRPAGRRRRRSLIRRGRPAGRGGSRALRLTAQDEHEDDGDDHDRHEDEQDGETATPAAASAAADPAASDEGVTAATAEVTATPAAAVATATTTDPSAGPSQEESEAQEHQSDTPLIPHCKLAEFRVMVPVTP